MTGFLLVSNIPLESDSEEAWVDLFDPSEGCLGWSPNMYSLPERNGQNKSELNIFRWTAPDRKSRKSEKENSGGEGQGSVMWRMRSSSASSWLDGFCQTRKTPILRFHVGCLLEKAWTKHEATSESTIFGALPKRYLVWRCVAIANCRLNAYMHIYSVAQETQKYKGNILEPVLKVDQQGKIKRSKTRLWVTKYIYI